MPDKLQPKDYQMIMISIILNFCKSRGVGVLEDVILLGWRRNERWESEDLFFLDIILLEGRDLHLGKGGLSEQDSYSKPATDPDFRGKES